MMRWWIVVALVACTPRSNSGDEAEDDGVAVVIDGAEVSRAEFVEALLAARGAEYMPRFIEGRLVERQAEKFGVQADPARVALRVDRGIEELVAGRYGGERAALEAQLEAYGLDFAGWRAKKIEAERLQQLVEGLIRADVSDERVKALFDVRFGKDGVRRRARHILISTRLADSQLYTREEYAAEKPRLEAKVRREAQAAREQLERGGDFVALAKERSDDASTAKEGGDLGASWGGRFGQGFDEAVRRLRVGQTSEVVEGRRGFHIARVTGVRKGARYRGAHIFIKAKPEDGPDEAARFKAAKARAEALRKKLTPENFGPLARGNSDEPKTQAQAGELGEFAPGRLGPQVDPVLETMPVGSISQPIRTREGFEIVHLTEREFLPAQDTRTVSHVLFSTEYPRIKARKLAGKIDDQAKAKAEKLLAQATAAEADFARLARAHSEDPLTRRSGGILDQMGVGRLPPELDAALGEMKPAETRLVKSEQGYHVLRLEAVKRADFDKVKDQLRRELERARPNKDEVSAYVKGLREAAQVEVKLDLTP